MWKEKDSFREMDLFELGEEEMEIVGQKVEMRRVKQSQGNARGIGLVLGANRVQKRGH